LANPIDMLFKFIDSLLNPEIIFSNLIPYRVTTIRFYDLHLSREKFL